MYFLIVFIGWMIQSGWELIYREEEEEEEEEVTSLNF